MSWYVEVEGYSRAILDIGCYSLNELFFSMN